MNIQGLYELSSWEWPEDADEIIVNALVDKKTSPEERLMAAELAGDHTVINDTIARHLLAIVENRNEIAEMRCEAALSLGGSLEQAYFMGFEDPDDIFLTESMVDDVKRILKMHVNDPSVPKTFQRACLESSVHYPEPWHNEVVGKIYRMDELEWKETALFCMQFLDGYDSEILESLESCDPRIQYQAVCASGVKQMPEAWPHIVRLIRGEDTEKNLLIAAIEAAALMNPLEAPELFGHLTDCGDEDISFAVHDALSMILGECDDDMDDGK